MTDAVWINAKFTSECTKCGVAVIGGDPLTSSPGDRVLYVPDEKAIYCRGCVEDNDLENEFEVKNSQGSRR